MERLLQGERGTRQDPYGDTSLGSLSLFHCLILFSLRAFLSLVSPMALKDFFDNLLLLRIGLTRTISALESVLWRRDLRESVFVRACKRAMEHMRRRWRMERGPKAAAAALNLSAIRKQGQPSEASDKGHTNRG